ncbi:MAG: hypothetical protein LC794_14895 [Acidobacteria bacterium]|nr:hypothetical protein [Acidobacteriota bacterium]
MNLRARKIPLLFFCLAVLAVCAVAVQAQSGRRKITPPPAAPVPTPTPEPTPAPKPEEKENELGFIIGSDSFGTYEVMPLTYYDAVMRGCADRLRSGSSAHVTIAQENMSRGDAIKKAKAQTTTYVILMKLVLDPMYAKSYNDLEVEYVLFAPQTAKVVTSGRTYLNVNRRGPVVVGPTRRDQTSALYREQLLKQAGEDAATRILKTLNLSVRILR